MATTNSTSELTVVTAADKTTAELVIPSEFDRSILSAQSCHAVLMEHGVEVNDRVVREVAALIADQTATRAIVARADPPKPGIDGHIEWCHNNDEQPDGEESGQDHRVSHYDRSAYRMVRAGDVLAKIHDPVLGQDGRDVNGGTIPARVGKTVTITLDESIGQNSKGELVAQVDGVLVHTPNNARLGKVLEIAQYVDFSTGNIDFTGNVCIKRGVRDCFVVKATGNVIVRGLIEAATIKCEGDLIAQGGMAGREQGTASVGGSLYGKYLDNVVGDIKGNLCIDREVINCRFTIHGGIDSPRGAVIGGKHVITGAVNVSTLGSPASVVTELVLGTVPRLDPWVKGLEPMVQAFTNEVEKLEHKCDRLHNSPRLSAAEKERRTEIMFELHECESNRAKAQMAMDAITRNIGQRRTIEVAVARILHPGVVLVIGDMAFKIGSEVKGPLTIRRDPVGDIVYSKHHGSTSLLSTIASVRSSN